MALFKMLVTWRFSWLSGIAKTTGGLTFNIITGSGMLMDDDKSITNIQSAKSIKKQVVHVIIYKHLSIFILPCLFC